MEFGVEGDFGFEGAGDGAVLFGVGGDFLEVGVVDAGDLGVGVEVDFGDGPVAIDLVEAEVCFGGNFFGAVASFAEEGGEGHAEAAGMGGGDEFFAVGAGALFEAVGEGVVGVFEGAALRADGSLAGFEVAVPDGGSCSCHRIE